MDSAPAHFLRHHDPAAIDVTAWGNGALRLRVAGYLSNDFPPDRYITSALAVVLRRGTVLVIRDAEEQVQLLPGGRREPGESLLETLRREILEETGIEIRDPEPLGFLHFRHLGPRPPGYTYPYPDFVQAVYLARAGAFRPDAIMHDDHVTASEFYPAHDLATLPLSACDRAYLSAALDRPAEGGSLD